MLTFGDNSLQKISLISRACQLTNSFNKRNFLGDIYGDHKVLRSTLSSFSDEFLLTLLFNATTIHKKFETNSSLHVK